MRRIIAILLLATILMSVFVIARPQVHALSVVITVTFDGKLLHPSTWSVHIKIVISLYAIKTLVLKPVTAVAGAFSNIAILLPGWTSSTDGQSYLNLTAPTAFNTTDDRYIGNFDSVYSGPEVNNRFTWQACDVNGAVIASGSVLDYGTVGGVVLPTPKFILLAPYFGLASAILAATLVSTLYLKRAKRREEKQ